MARRPAVASLTVPKPPKPPPRHWHVVSPATPGFNYLAKLPNEVVSEILITWLDEYWLEKDKGISYRDECCGLKPQCHLSLVCHHFQVIVHSTARLWRRVTIESDKDIEHEYRWARVCFRLSRACRLDIVVDWALLDDDEKLQTRATYCEGHLDICDVMDLMEVLSPHLNRCASLCLRFIPCSLAVEAFRLLSQLPVMPVLRTLFVETAGVQDFWKRDALTLPRLQVTFPNMANFVTAGNILDWEHFHYHNLTSLTLWRVSFGVWFTLDELRGILAESPHLGNLELVDLGLQEEGSSLGVPCLSLLSLADLHISCVDADDVVKILSLFRAPALSGLKLGLYGLEDNFESVISALVACAGASSLETITTLEITHFHICYKPAVLRPLHAALFRTMPNVEELVVDLTGVPWGKITNPEYSTHRILALDTLAQSVSMDTIQTPAGAKCTLLPHLKTLQICGKSVPAGHLAWGRSSETFIRARYEAGLSLRTLTLSPQSWTPEELEAFVPWVGRIRSPAGHVYNGPDWEEMHGNGTNDEMSRPTRFPCYLRPR